MVAACGERYPPAAIHRRDASSEDLMIFMTSKHAARRAHLGTLACGATLLLTASFAAHAGRLYVSNEDGHTVTVIDTDKNEAIATIPVGKRPRGIQVSHDGALVYVALERAAEVSTDGSRRRMREARARCEGRRCRRGRHEDAQGGEGVRGGLGSGAVRSRDATGVSTSRMKMPRRRRCSIRRRARSLRA